MPSRSPAGSEFICLHLQVFLATVFPAYFSEVVQVKHLLHLVIIAYNNYLQFILGLSENETETTSENKGVVSEIKKIFSLIKNARQDAS